MKDKNQYNKVILAEDDEGARKKFKDLFEALGCVVFEVHNSKDAVITALSEKPLCILFDLDSSDNDWLETALAIRNQSELRKIPILTTSKDGGRGIELYRNIESFGDEMIEYLPQPISEEELAFHIDLMLSQKAAANSNAPQ